MIPKRWCLLWTRHLHPVSKVRPRSGLHLLLRTRDIWHTLWITLVDLGVIGFGILLGLFGGPQMRILGGFIMKVNFFLWLHPDVYLWSRFYQHQGTLGEGSWVNVNLLDNPSWLSNPGGMKLSNPRYSTIPPYIVLAFCLVLDSSVGFLVPFLTPKEGISKYGMSWEARVTWFPRFLAVFQFPYPWGMKFSSTRYLRSLT